MGWEDGRRPEGRLLEESLVPEGQELLKAEGSQRLSPTPGTGGAWAEGQAGRGPTLPATPWVSAENVSAPWWVAEAESKGQWPDRL